MPASLVIDHDKLAAAIGPAPVIQPVNPAGHCDQLGAGSYRPFHSGRLTGRIKSADVALHHHPGPVAIADGLSGIGESLVDPAPLQQVTRGRHTTLAPGQPPPPGQRVMDARADAIVRPRRSLGRRRAVQVGHPVPARAIEPRAQPGRRARVQPTWHALETELLHSSILARWSDSRLRGRPAPAAFTRIVLAAMGLHCAYSNSAAPIATIDQQERCAAAAVAAGLVNRASPGRRRKPRPAAPTPGGRLPSQLAAEALVGRASPSRRYLRGTRRGQRRPRNRSAFPLR